MNLIPSSATRVPDHTASSVNRSIADAARQRVEYFARHPARIHDRLRELDEQWDVERLLEVNSSILSLAGLALGLAFDRRWLALPLVVQSFFLMHAVEGWCPPLPVLRRMGVRTREEINAERVALQALRGDFDQVRHGPGSQHDAAQRAFAAAAGSRA